MREPQRLKDMYAGKLEGVVLGSARVDVPSIRARHRTLVTLGLAATATGLPVATTAAAGAKTVASVGLAVAVKWGAIGLTAGALTLGGIRAAPQWLGPRVPRPVSTAIERKARAPLERSVEGVPREERDPQPTTVEPQAARAENALQVPRMNARKNVSPPSPTDRSTERKDALEPPLVETRLAEEVAALDQARQVLKTDPERSLELIDDYVSRFPSGELRPEALVLRIDALVRADRRPRAEAQASDYVSRFPRSPHAKRIRRLMGWSDDVR
jgi:hypothetical protein